MKSILSESFFDANFEHPTCKGKRFIQFLPLKARTNRSLLPLQGDIINILIPRALPWAIVTLGFQPVILQ